MIDTNAQIAITSEIFLFGNFKLIGKKISVQLKFCRKGEGVETPRCQMSCGSEYESLLIIYHYIHQIIITGQ